MNESNFLPGDAPPTDLPVPEDPGADGAKIASGLVSGLIGYITSLPVLRQLAAALLTLVGFVIGGLLNITSWLAVKVADIFFQGVEGSEDAFNRLASEAIYGLLGKRVEITGAGKMGTSDGRRKAARDIGDGVIDALFMSSAPPNVDGLQPGDEGARNLLSRMVTMGLEGWFIELLNDAIRHGDFEKLGELKEVFLEGCGLSRLGRTGLRPLAHILIALPLQWKLNKQYRPTMLSAGELIKAVVRGKITREQAIEELARDGYADWRIEQLLSSAGKRLSVSDLDYMLARGLIDRQFAAQEINDDGWTIDDIDRVLTLHNDKRLQGSRRALADEYVRAFVEREIDDAQLQRNLVDIEIPDDEKAALLTLAHLKRSNHVKHLSEHEIEECVHLGIRGIDDYREYNRRLGYSPEDALARELLLLHKNKQITDVAAAHSAAVKAKQEAAATKAAALKAKQQQAAQKSTAKAVTLAEFQQLVRTGARSLDEYAVYLQGLHYSDADVQDLTALLATQMQQSEAAAAKKASIVRVAAGKGLTLADEEKAVLDGVISIDDYRQWLAAHNFASADVEVLVHLLQDKQAAQATAYASKSKAAAKLGAKDISLTQLERAVRLGVRTIDDYRSRLVAENFTADAADVLVQLLADQIAQDNTARQKRDAANKAAAGKSISLAQLEEAVRVGLRPMADYRAALKGLQYGTADQATLVSLLQLKVDAYKAAQAKRPGVDAALAAKHISLAQVERAVKLGVMSLAQYSAFLHAQGFAQDDADILTASIQAEVQKTQAAKATRAATAASSPGKVLSEQQMRASVLAGVRPLGDYTTLLHTLGYAPDAVDTLSELLGDELAQKQDAVGREAQADGELAVKGIALADFRAAVKDGSKTLAEYQAFLEDHGYGVQDVATLVDLLGSQVDAKQAKAAGKQAAAAPGPVAVP